MQGKEIEKLTKIIAKLPALGTRSARRIVLQLLKKKETAHDLRLKTQPQ